MKKVLLENQRNQSENRKNIFWNQRIQTESFRTKINYGQTFQNKSEKKEVY